MSLTNCGTRPREIEVTSYAEIVLASAAADAAHPAFSNLFVQTEFVPSVEALLAGRRPRDREEPVWAAQVMTVQGEMVGTVQYETDRARFLGPRAQRSVTRSRSRSGGRSPTPPAPFSTRSSACVAGCVSLPGATARVHLATVVARLAGRGAGARRQVPGPRDVRPRVEPRVDAGAGPTASPRDHRPTRRTCSSGSRRGSSIPTRACARRSRLSCATAGAPSALWRHGISGDVPIVLVRIDQVEDQGIVRQLLRAHEYWKMKGLAVDLVIVNEQPASYSPELGSDASSRSFAPGAELRVSPRSIDRARLRAAREGAAPPRTRTRFRRPRASSCCRGRERWHSRSSGCCTGYPSRGRRFRSRRGRRKRTCLRRGFLSSFSTGIGRLLGRERGVRDAARRAAVDPGARGSTSSPTLRSDASCRSRDPATRGRSTAGRTNSRRGRTIR